MIRLRIILGFLFISLFFACEEKQKESREDNLKHENDFSGREREIKLYNEENQLVSKGKINKDSLRIGIWEFNEENQKVIKEYKIVNNEEYVNQIWFLDKKGDTLYNKGNFFSLFIKDTVKVNEVITMKILYDKPFLSTKSQLTLLLPKSFANITSIDDLNQAEVKFDTILNLEKNQQDFLQGQFKNMPKNHMIIKHLKFSSPGVKTIRGILKEEFLEEDSSVKERILYLETDILVLKE